ALDAGADDYMTKPFGVGELQARLRVLMRRYPGSEKNDPVYEFGDICVDIAGRQVRKGGEEVHLTPIEFRLLTILIGHSGKVLTQRQLL
ncbi:winged helix-turn-helix domain-containing protein, partial [Klebsiella pneumoniae]|nr:winged helix-turn-helix domain-containing protein [Klebsiella pneumoniae]